MKKAKEMLIDQITKENNRLNRYGDEMIDLLHTAQEIQPSLVPVFNTLMKDFDNLTNDLTNVELVITLTVKTEAIRSLVHLVNQQSYKVASFKSKLDTIAIFLGKGGGAS